MKKTDIEEDGALVIVETVQQDNGKGVMVENMTRISIDAGHIEKFRRDNDFDDSLPPGIKAKLDAAK